VRITSRIDPPGHEAAHDKLYRLDGTKKLEGNMDADGYNIKNIGSLELAGDVVLGAECDQKYIGTTDTGMLVSCVGASVNNSENTEKKGKWRIPNELPVGAVYISLTEDNPSGLLGYVTWESFGAGQVMVGQTGTLPTDCQTKVEAGEEGNSALKSVECWPYILGGTYQDNTTNTTEDAALALRQMPDHRHWRTINRTCSELDPGCWVISDLAVSLAEKVHAGSSARQRVQSTNRLTPQQLAEFQAAIEAAYALEEEVKALLAETHRRPQRDIDEDDELSEEGHQHKINQPSIVVKMWQRIE